VEAAGLEPATNRLLCLLSYAPSIFPSEGLGPDRQRLITRNDPGLPQPSDC
jgi:hypothetical protein